MTSLKISVLTLHSCGLFCGHFVFNINCIYLNDYGFNTKKVF